MNAMPQTQPAPHPDALIDRLNGAIRDIPDFPSEGIVFKDITPMLQDARLFRAVTDHFRDRYADRGITQVVGIESRGFIFGAALAYALEAGLVLVRKPGKLPHTTHAVDYALEYGTDRVEVHTDALTPDDRVLLLDDVLATGGTAAAAAELVTRCGATIDECAFLIELDFLKGRAKLGEHQTYSLLHY